MNAFRGKDGTVHEEREQPTVVLITPEHRCSCGKPITEDQHITDGCCAACLAGDSRSARRPQITDATLDRAQELFSEHFGSVLGRKGHGSFASIHEALGVIVEEQGELVAAVQAKDPQAIRGELLDIAVACIFAYACVLQSAMDW